MGKYKKNIVVNEKLEFYKDSDTIRFVDEIKELVDKHNVVILMRNSGYGLTPFRLMSFHQINMATLEDELEKHGDIRSFTVVPANSDNYIDIAKVELEYIPDNIDALQKEMKKVIEDMKKEAEETIKNIKGDLETDIEHVEERFLKLINEAKREAREIDK